MKQIKFNAWDSYKKKMYDWNQLVVMDMNGQLTLSNLLNGFVKHIKPLQFTTRKDMHGKEIYVGHKLEWKHAEQYKKNLFHKQSGVVGLHNGCFGCFGNPFYEWSTSDNGILTENKYVTSGCIVGSDLYYIMFDIEIIGHIYEDKYKHLQT